MTNRIKELRLRKNLTIKELSEKLKNQGTPISPDSLSKYEREQRQPKWEKWSALANFFNVPLDFIRGNTEDVSELSQRAIYILSYVVEGLNPDLPEENFESLENAVHSFEKYKNYDLLELMFDNNDVFIDDTDENSPLYKVFEDVLNYDFFVSISNKSVISNDAILSSEITKRINEYVEPLKKEIELRNEKKQKNNFGISFSEIDKQIQKKEMRLYQAFLSGQSDNVKEVLNDFTNFINNIKRNIP